MHMAKLTVVIFITSCEVRRGDKGRTATYSFITLHKGQALVLKGIFQEVSVMPHVDSCTKSGRTMS